MPLRELGIAEELLNEPPFNSLNGEVSFSQFLRISADEEKVRETMGQFKKLQKVVRSVNWIFFGDGLILVLVLAGYFALGSGRAKL